MPVRGENPITSYFPRITPNSKVSTPTGTKLKSAKRARHGDESDSGKENSRKKSKGREGVFDEDSDFQATPSVSSRVTSRHSKIVIELLDTPPSTPVKSASKSCATPPSSPLPELTPSPKSTLAGARRSSVQSHMGISDDTIPGPSHTTSAASMEASYAERCEIELELVPSSQTQTLDTFFCDEESSCSLDPTPSRSSILEPTGNSDRSWISLTATLHRESLAAPDELVASSQSQFLDLASASPADPDVELVPSSQSQELSHSQAFSRPFRRVISAMSNGHRTSLMDGYFVPSEREAPRAIMDRSPPNIELLGHQNNHPGTNLDDDVGSVPSSLPGSQLLPSHPSSPGGKGDDRLPSSQQSENLWNDEPASYGSLPDAVKEFRDMFSGTYESYPSDFPMSLRE